MSQIERRNLKKVGHLGGIVGVFKDVLSTRKNVSLTDSYITIRSKWCSIVLNDNGRWWFEDFSG